MKKWFLTLAVTSSLLSGSVLGGQAWAVDQLTGEIVKSVYFREQPSVNSDVIRSLKAKEKVQIIEKVNAYWYKVKDKNNKVGYVSSMEKYIKVSEDTPDKPVQPADQQTGVLSENQGVIVSSVSFRTGPSTSNKRLRYLKRGETVTILDKVNAYWYKVKDKQGEVGYVSTNAKYIQANYKPVSEKPVSAPQPDASELAQKVIAAGKKYLGTPYEYGSSRSNTSTFDCSDFVRQAFLDAAGIRLPADSRQQGEYVRGLGTTTTNWKNLKPGDLMFFMSYKGTKASSYDGINKNGQTITHVGIYLGDGQILHTYSKESGGVRIDHIAGRHWEFRFLFGGSALE